MDALLLTLVLLQSPPAAPPAAREPLLVHALIGASMVAHGADLATTMYCRGARTCSEANPALRWLQDEPVAFAAAKMSLAVAANYALLRLHKSHPKIVTVMAAAQVVGIGYVAYRNSHQGSRE